MWLVWNWEESFKFFVDLEKGHAIQNQIRIISYDEKEITDEEKIIKKPFLFYKALFKKKKSTSQKSYLFEWS